MCLFPVTLKSKDAFGFDTNVTVPCGKCLECVKDYQNAWKIRLTEEAKVHKHVYFFTLTYNDDSVPFEYDDEGNKCLTVRKSDVQLWLKRNRMRFQRSFDIEVDFKYFITSEYGPNTGRPHYHGIIFTEIEPSYIASMFNDWSTCYGFTNFSEVGVKGKKKDEEMSPPLEVTFLSTAVSRRLFSRKPKFVLSDLPKLVSFSLTLNS